MKTMKTISINPEVWNSAQKNFPNELSSRIEDFLTLLNAQKKGDFDTMDYEILLKKRAENAAKLGEISAKQAEIQQKLGLIQQKKDEIELQNIEKMKEEMQKMTKCALCGDEIKGENTLKIKNKQFCKACFYGNTPQFISEFIKKQDEMQEK